MNIQLIVSLIFGLFSVFVVIAGVAASVYIMASNNLKAAEKAFDAKIDALRTEMMARIEALRIETKDDRHNYVSAINAALAGLKEDVHEVDIKLAALIATSETISSVRLELQNGR